MGNLEIIAKSDKCFGRKNELPMIRFHFWGYLKATIVSTLYCDVEIYQYYIKDHFKNAVQQYQDITQLQCTKWLNDIQHNKLNIENSTFKDILHVLDTNSNHEFLRIRNSYSISSRLLILFWYFDFSHQNQFTEMLQDILNRSSFTFDFLSQKVFKGWGVGKSGDPPKSAPVSSFLPDFESSYNTTQLLSPPQREQAKLRCSQNCR